jgi:small basic protein
MVGWLWIALSVLAALALWRVATALRARLLATYVDENVVAPRVIDPILGALVFLVLLLGLTVGLALVVFAGRSPRRPR